MTELLIHLHKLVSNKSKLAVTEQQIKNYFAGLLATALCHLVNIFYSLKATSAQLDQILLVQLADYAASNAMPQLARQLPA